MKYYTDWEAAFDQDDFIKNRMTIFKKFTVGNIRYTLHYVTGSRIITVTKSIAPHYMQRALSTEFLDDMMPGGFQIVCDSIREFTL